MAPNGKKENLLSSWKEIAAYLDRDVRTCVRWEKKYGLPVHRLDKDAKSKVFANRDEIDRWLAERSAQEALSSEGPAGSRRPSWVVAVLSSVAVLVLVAVAYFLIHRPGNPGATGVPSGFRIQGSVLTVTNGAGAALWSKDLKVDDLLDEAYYRQHFQVKSRGSDYNPLWPFLLFKDIDGDGRLETLFAIKARGEVNEGILICFDAKGKERWRFEAGRAMDFGGKRYRNEYRIVGLDVADYDEDGRPEILLLSAQKPDWPCQVALLDSNGTLKAEYWNSGYLMDALSQDIDGDGLKETVLSGVNNEYRKGCVVIFKGGRLGGGSPQDSAAFRSPSLGRGMEIAYILVPNAGFHAAYRQEGDAVNYIWARRGQGFTAMAHDSQIYFDFDAGLACAGVTVSHATRNLYTQLVSEGKISGPLDELLLRKKMEEGILYRGEGRWVPRPPAGLPGR